MKPRTLRIDRIVPLLSLLALAGLAAAFPAREPPPEDEPNRPMVPGGYSIDPTHSTVFFRVKHLGASWSYGRFDKATGSVRIDPHDLSKSSIAIEIDVASLDTGNDKRDGHLKGPDFFDAVQFSVATFGSRTIAKTGETTYEATGDLEIHGVVKEVTVPFEYVGTFAGKRGVKAGFHAVFDIRRSDFGMEFMPDAVGDDVQVTVSLELNQTEHAK